MSSDWNLIELDDLGVLRLYGADGVRFLQGQVSNNVERLTPELSQLAGYHNPQGRAIALLRLVQLAPDDLLAILPRELAAPVAGRLTKFILRSKVKIVDESGSWHLTGLVAPHRLGAGIGPASVAAHPQAGAHMPAAGFSIPGPQAHETDGSVGLGRPGSAAAEAESSEPRGTADRLGAMGAETRGPVDEEASATGLEGAFESRARSWAAAQFEEASALAASAGERNSAAAQLEDADSVVELPTASALMLPDSMNAQSASGATIVVRVGMAQARWLVIAPTGAKTPLSGCTPAERDAWRLLDIADGMPQVYATTSEEFVAQMLNLDALGAIAFDKGCYTGQEVIARAHYRGRVKRRLQRFMTRAPAKLAIGDSGAMADGRSFKVVEAAQLANGRCEFLAVLPTTAGEMTAPDGSTGAVELPSGDVSNAGQGGRLDVDVLPLPYPLPE
jgi:folate-binding protein YgfZ